LIYIVKGPDIGRKEKKRKEKKERKKETT